MPQAVDQLGQFAEACHRADLTYGLEIEANLVGCTGQILAEIHRQVNHPGMVLIFDAANVLVQGFSPAESVRAVLGDEARARLDAHQGLSLPGAGSSEKGRPVDEDALAHFVPADVGDCAHEAILRDFSRILPAVERKLRRRGIPGVFLDLEPHLKGGGQFGGFSGPDGMGVALRALPRARLRGHRLPSPRLRRHPGRPRVFM